MIWFAIRKEKTVAPKKWIYPYFYLLLLLELRSCRALKIISISDPYSWENLNDNRADGWLAKRETVNSPRDKFPTKPLQRHDATVANSHRVSSNTNCTAFYEFFMKPRRGVRQQTVRRGNDFARWTAEINRLIFATDRVTMRFFLQCTYRI